MNEPGRKVSRGCLYNLGVVGAMTLLVLIVASFLGYLYAKRLITAYTDTQPMPVPSVQMSRPELDGLQNRIAVFSQAVEQGKTVEPLKITSEEANALIESHPKLVTVTGRLYFSMEGTNLHAQVSIPAGDLGLRPLKGRYLNATGTFKIVFTNGVLNVNAQSLSSKGQVLPESFMHHIQPQNFAFKLNHDPRAQAVLSKVGEVHIQDGTLVVVPKQP